jgi:hypothetical protein
VGSPAHQIDPQKALWFLSLVVLGKTVHNPSFVGFEFCGQFMRDRYVFTKNSSLTSILNLKFISLSAIFG